MIESFIPRNRNRHTPLIRAGSALDEVHHGFQLDDRELQMRRGATRDVEPGKRRRDEPDDARIRPLADALKLQPVGATHQRLERVGRELAQVGTTHVVGEPQIGLPPFHV